MQRVSRVALRQEFTSSRSRDHFRSDISLISLDGAPVDELRKHNLHSSPTVPIQFETPPTIGRCAVSNKPMLQPLAVGKKCTAAAGLRQVPSKRKAFESRDSDIEDHRRSLFGQVWKDQRMLHHSMAGIQCF
eukprot:s404_g30.t1